MADLTLILNAAEARLQIVFIEDELILSSQDLYAARNGTEILAPNLDFSLKTLNKTTNDIDKIAIVTGPGSFTGLRLTLATSYALVRAAQPKLIPQASLNFLMAIAQNLPYEAKPKYIRVITNAKRNLVHCQDFIQINKQLQEISSISLIEPIKAAKFSVHKEYDYCLVGSGNTKYYEQIAEVKAKKVQQYSASFDSPYSTSLMHLAMHAEYSNADPEAIYTRSCDAIDNIEQISEKLGLDAQKSLEKLEELQTRVVLF